MVTTRGVVTATRSNGFYLQSRPGDEDNDPATSEGIFVFTSKTPPAAATRGAFVRVTGTVAEYRPASDPGSPTLTELIGDIQVTVEGLAALPDAVALTRSLVYSGRGFDNLEHLEGMRVLVESMLAAGPTASNGSFIGVLEGAPRPMRLRGASEFPELLRVDTAAQRGGRIEAMVGTRVSGLSGPLDFNQRMWTLVADPADRTASELKPARPLIAPTSSEFTIANLNLLSLASNAQTAARLAKLSLLVRDILRLPDILAVEECTTLAVLEAAAARINQDAVANGLPDPRYQAFLEEGNDSSGIDVGFLVKTARVEVRFVNQYGKDATYVRPDGRPELLNDRPPLVLRARIDGRFPVTVVANHLRSMTDIDTAASGPRIRLKRSLQARYLRDLLQTLTLEAPGEPIAATGDFNAFQFESMPGDDPLAVVTGGPPHMQALTDRLPLDQNGSYVYNGVSQTLDHILVNRSLAGSLSRIAYTRVNAAYPDSLSANASRPERFSDHEAVMAWFSLVPPAFSSATVYDVSTVEGPGIGPGRSVTVNGGDATVLLVAPGVLSMVFPSGIDGTARLAVGESEIELPIQNAVPGILSAAVNGDALEIYATGLSGQAPTLTIGGIVCEVTSAEPAPDRVAGVTLIRAVPPPAKDYILVLTVGENSSDPYNILP
ncbi:MAG: endonuclease/exonuclease/phosphatase family protein [Acidobacteria bacterium]|nr:endonuclease/exonuclease/phosphatase family protein [Acidobacteriota bacterium]